METKEFIKERSASSGFIHLVIDIIWAILIVAGSIHFSKTFNEDTGGLFCSIGVLFLMFHVLGYALVQPNKAVVLTFFGVYSGTLKKNGFYWLNPLYGKKKITLRARNLDVEPIKVNDKNGNPIMIGLVSVWKIEDTYKAAFEIDAEKPLKRGSASVQVVNMEAYENFVRVQSDAALRKIAGLYAYDHSDSSIDEITLRSGGEEINERLESELTERLSIAGIKIVEARINYLAYASEIAGAMLRRQQAEAIISAREKIVEGAVSMVELALNRLSEKEVVTLDEERKAAMVSNLMVVLCADEAASPVINAGTLY